MAYEDDPQYQALFQQQQAMDNAVAQANQQAAAGAARRAQEDPLTLQDFYKAPTEQAPAPINYKRERARSNIANITDAIVAMGNMIGATQGAQGMVTPSLSAANQARYDKLMQQRKDDQQVYDNAVRNAQSLAQMNYSAARQARADRWAAQMDREQAATNVAKGNLETAARNLKDYRQQEQEAYNREHTRQRDEATDTNNRQIRQDARDREDRLYDRQVLEHNDTLKGYYVINNGDDSRGIPKSDFPRYVSKVYDKLVENPNIAGKPQVQAIMNQLKMPGLSSEDIMALKQEVINLYLEDSPEAQRLADGFYKPIPYRTYSDGSTEVPVTAPAQATTAPAATAPAGYTTSSTERVPYRNRFTMPATAPAAAPAAVGDSTSQAMTPQQIEYLRQNGITLVN